MKKKQQKQKLYTLLTFLAIGLMIVASVGIVRSISGGKNGTAAANKPHNGTSVESQTGSGEEEKQTEEIVVSELSGIAYVERNGVGFELEEQAILRLGDVVETKTGGQLTLTQGEGMTALDEQTELALASEQNIAEVSGGTVFRKTGAAEKKTEDSLRFFQSLQLIPEEGSVYAVSVQTGSATLQVFRGQVEVQGATEDGDTVQAGESRNYVKDDDDLTVEQQTLAASDCSAFVLEQALKQEDLVFAAEELKQVQADREAVKQAEADALKAHEAEVIANGVENGTDAGSRGSTGGTDSAGNTGTSGRRSGSGNGGAAQTRMVTISIQCGSVLQHMDLLKEGKSSFVPANGVILATCQVAYSEGETVFDILKRACAYTGISLEYSYSGTYGSYYIEGINQLYEFDCGNTSGWVYSVNGWSPNYGCSSYQVKPGDAIVWNYQCP